MASKSPLALVKETFGDKSKLVEAVEKLGNDGLWVARVNEKKGLAHVSNAKLLRLHAIFTAVKEKFGSREKLIDAILDLQQRAKDPGLRQRLAAWPVPRLYDEYRSTAKRRGVGVTPKKARAKGDALAAAAAKGKTPKKTAKKASAKSSPPGKKSTKKRGSSKSA
jgi:hypothetical protein